MYAKQSAFHVHECVECELRLSALQAMKKDPVLGDPRAFLVVPLHSTLSSQDQHKVGNTLSLFSFYVCADTEIEIPVLLF